MSRCKFIPFIRGNEILFDFFYDFFSGKYCRIKKSSYLCNPNGTNRTAERFKREVH